MPYEVEDEIDWSDGSLRPPSPRNPKNLVILKTPVEPQEEEHNTDRVCNPATENLFELPQGSPLPSSAHMGINPLDASILHHAAFEPGNHEPALPSRAQRARFGIHQNRRKPTKDDYMNFALYQANQKAYEATFLKNFVAHALHPDRITTCPPADPEFSADITVYLRSVLHNVNGLADKMIWNAHCRAVNLLANDGKDGAPFLDVHQIGQGMFREYGPQNLVSVVNRMNESWHRATSKPVMVQMSTKQYPISFNSSPLEEIDAIGERVFKDLAFTSALPTGRATQPLTGKRGKGRGKSGAILREQPLLRSRGNWLVLPQLDKPERSITLPPILLAHPEAVADSRMMGDDAAPRIIKYLRNMQPPNDNLDKPIQSTAGDTSGAKNGSTQLEDLFSLYGSAAPESDRAGTSAHSDEVGFAAKVPSWPSRLIRDHKRRITLRRGNQSQTLQIVLPGIKQVIAEALALGYQPTSRDYQHKVRIIERQEQQRQDQVVASAAPDSEPPLQPSNVPLPSRLHSAQHAPTRGTGTKKQCIDTPRKRQKTNTVLPSLKKGSPLTKKPTRVDAAEKASPPTARVAIEVIASSSLHPSGSNTLANHQSLPPSAYFEPQKPDEKPAWRCGINHAMGHYYNAGDRTSCVGCFTNIKANAKTRDMDFYLPSSVFFFQPALGNTWKPSKPREGARRSPHLSHNSIAKEAYWKYIGDGATAEEARRAGVGAVEAALRPRTPKEPTPELTPEPEPDLGPHPSGSSTMEHGQDIPECAYLRQLDEDEEHAWRCDINHALGRYYLAGDKRSCPGCGSNKNGAGKHSDMDFYMPPGTVVRQEAPTLSRWAPRKPYKTRKPGPCATPKNKYLTHNQACSKKYFEAIDAGHDPEEAVRMAIDAVEAELEAKEAAQHEESEDPDEAELEEIQDSGCVNETIHHGSKNIDGRRDSAQTNNDGNLSDGHYQSNLRGGYTVALVPRKRASEDMSDDEEEDGEVHDTSDSGKCGNMDQKMIDFDSSDDEETSGSDSE